MGNPDQPRRQRRIRRHRVSRPGTRWAIFRSHLSWTHHTLPATSKTQSMNFLDQIRRWMVGLGPRVVKVHIHVDWSSVPMATCTLQMDDPRGLSRVIALAVPWTNTATWRAQGLSAGDGRPTTRGWALIPDGGEVAFTASMAEAAVCLRYPLDVPQPVWSWNAPVDAPRVSLSVSPGNAPIMGIWQGPEPHSLVVTSIYARGFALTDQLSPEFVLRTNSDDATDAEGRAFRARMIDELSVALVTQLGPAPKRQLALVRGTSVDALTSRDPCTLVAPETRDGTELSRVLLGYQLAASYWGAKLRAPGRFGAFVTDALRLSAAIRAVAELSSGLSGSHIRASIQTALLKLSPGQGREWYEGVVEGAQLVDLIFDDHSRRGLIAGLLASHPASEVGATWLLRQLGFDRSARRWFARAADRLRR